jgi:hypothetical protein
MRATKAFFDYIPFRRFLGRVGGGGGKLCEKKFLVNATKTLASTAWWELK